MDSTSPPAEPNWSSSVTHPLVEGTVVRDSGDYGTIASPTTFSRFTIKELQDPDNMKQALTSFLTRGATVTWQRVLGKSSVDDQVSPYYRTDDADSIILGPTKASMSHSKMTILPVEQHLEIKLTGQNHQPSFQYVCVVDHERSAPVHKLVLKILKCHSLNGSQKPLTPGFAGITLTMPLPNPEMDQISEPQSQFLTTTRFDTSEYDDRALNQALGGLAELTQDTDSEDDETGGDTHISLLGGPTFIPIDLGEPR